MSNHFHLLVKLPDPRQVSTLMAGLLRAYVHHCHRRHGFVGHRWQGRFKSPAIQMESYLLSCGRYIERNPLEAGMVSLPWEYRWSSERLHRLDETDPLVRADTYYLQLSPEEPRRQERWREFLLVADVKEEAVRR